MLKKNRETMKDWIGKKIKVIFFDGDKTNSKIGILKAELPDFVVLKLYDTEEAISKRKIIRMEVME